jgi:hypothetical protein
MIKHKNIFFYGKILFLKERTPNLKINKFINGKNYFIENFMRIKHTF